MKPSLELCQSSPEPPQNTHPELQAFVCSKTNVFGDKQILHFQPLHIELIVFPLQSRHAFLSQTMQVVSKSKSL